MYDRPTAVTDPVCGMEVPPGQLDTTHLEIHYAFCSVQCRDRFIANPRLYIGRPGHKAPKQEGMEVIKRRRLHLSSALSSEQATILAAALREMMGVQHVLVADDRVEITYDLLQATAEQIEAKIAETGAGLGAGWADSLRLAFVHSVEEFEIDNLELPEHGIGY